uniref:Kri1-like C-terminal domain-containing protein n=1 Tax=Opuntia streptacantha TaxID=393608 RepID=A0A7C9EUJ3_OPUST
MGMSLFDDAGDDDVEKISEIEINAEFAKRYEHNKKREDLQRLEEMKKKGLITDSASDSESVSESESDVEDDEDDVKALFDGLLKVRKKDPILTEKDAKLFESSSDEAEDEDDDGESGDGKKTEKEKPKYLKDVRAQHLIEEGPEFDDEEENEKEKVMTFVEEQEDLRKAVLDAMAEAERENDEEDGDFLKLKERENPEDDGGVGDEEIEKRLDEYFGEDEKLDENDKFLKDFFKNKLWIDKDKGKRPIENDLVGISDDEEALEKQEDYEREYNFRFEENGSDRVLGHSRFVEGSVRKETNARKQQRERKKERLAQAELERREEVKRLKNLKKKEIQERLHKIREIAGISGESIPLTEEDLEEDFDPDEFDKKMKAAFGDNYYEAEDADPEFGSDGDESESDLEKPDFEKEDELLGLPKDWDVIKSNDGFLAAREKLLKSKADSEGDVDDDQLLLQEGKKKRKRKLSLKEKVALDKELEELYKLDYEDAIGDLKTRFKYREVAPRKYGLSAAHVLMMDDKELNQYVSLKKLAPYREKEWTVPRMQRTSFMLKRGALLEAAMNRQMGGKRRRKAELGETSRSREDEKAQMEQPSNDESKLSRAAKRRRRQKEKKIATV